MRQVPHYLIIGRGRLATHMAHYFTLLGVSYTIWHRDLSIPDLYSFCSKATHALILIKDDEIDSFLLKHLKHFSSLHTIHCSGAHYTELAFGAHPLMTFSYGSKYSLQEYRSIPFVIDESAPPFSLLFPTLSNPAFYISREKKVKYHALCALSGNLTSFLWQQFFRLFEKEFGFSKEIGFPYLNQIMNNLLSDPENALTGPVSRNDVITIAKHKDALHDNHLQHLYQAFITSFESYKKENKA